MSDAATIAPELLTPTQAAALLGLGRTTFDQLQAEGRIGPRPVRLSPRLIRWRRAELVAWLDAGLPSRGDWDARQEGGAR